MTPLIIRQWVAFAAVCIFSLVHRKDYICRELSLCFQRSICICPRESFRKKIQIAKILSQLVETGIVVPKTTFDVILVIHRSVI
jgi:hypothetical protein